MKRRSRSLDALLRVRRLERDDRARAHERASRERAAAERNALRGEETARTQRDALDRSGQTGVIAALWRSLRAGVGATHARGRSLRLAAASAGTSESLARSRRLEAERAVAGLENLLERRLRAERAEAARAEQHRLDDAASSRRGRIGCIALLVAASLLSPLHPAFAQADSRIESASLERLLSDIRTRTAELDRRASELDERESAVAELERAVALRIRELDAAAKRVEDRLVEWEEANGSKSVAKLARIYGAIPPPRAAELVEALELELATQIVRKMKPKQAAALLPLLSEPRALSISRFVGHPLGIVPPVASEAP